MSKSVFFSERYFVNYDFLISHRQLLIRSIKEKDNSKNIDVIFFDVSFIQMPTNFTGLRISKIQDISSITQLGINITNTTDIFELKTSGYNYYIIASMVKIYENDLDFNQSSLGLFETKGRDFELFSISPA